MPRWLIPALLVPLVLAAPAPAAAASLAGTEWRVTRVGSQAVGELRLELSFENRREFAGFDGCNRFSGRYRAIGSRLRFRRLVSTAIGCEGELPGLTSRLLRTRRYRLNGRRLELRRAGRTLVVLRRR